MGVTKQPLMSQTQMRHLVELDLSDFDCNLRIGGFKVVFKIEFKSSFKSAFKCQASFQIGPSDLNS